jgi:hypothetical protein
MVPEMRGAGWCLVAVGVTYLGSEGLVHGIPGRVGVCGFSLVSTGAVLATGGCCVHGNDNSDSSSDNSGNSGNALTVKLHAEKVGQNNATMKKDVLFESESSTYALKQKRGVETETEITSVIRPTVVGARWWNVWLLRGYFTTVYFYAGVAKLETDWLDGWTLREVLRLWTGGCLTACFSFRVVM